MKSTHIGIALTAVLGLVLGAVQAQQATPAQDREDPRQNDRPNQSTSDQAETRSSQSEKASKSVTRASELIGMQVKNNENEDLGAIEDLAIDAETGRVAYAAVSMGGFLGVGNKLFAIPWSSVECRSEQGSLATDPEQTQQVAIVDVNRKQLENSEGFDQDNWPDMANEAWQQQNDQPYRSTRAPETTTDREVR